MAAFVLDSSIAISWVMPDEIAQLDLLDKVIKEGAIVPTIWLLEIGNVLLCAERRKRLTTAQVHQALYNLKNLPIKLDSTTLDYTWFKAIQLAESQVLTLYDASYLELALRYGLPLATSDKLLKQACNNIGVASIGVSA